MLNAMHLVEIDGEFRYFTDCGMPASAGEPA